MRYANHFYPVGTDKVNQLIRKAREHNSSRFSLKDWPSERGFFNRRDYGVRFIEKALCGSRTALSLPQDRRFHLIGCDRLQANFQLTHRIAFFRRTWTSSHEIVCRNPASESAIRLRISTRHACSASSSTCGFKLSINESAIATRSSADRANACSNKSLEDFDIPTAYSAATR